MSNVIIEEIDTDNIADHDDEDQIIHDMGDLTLNPADLYMMKMNSAADNYNKYQPRHEYHDLFDEYEAIGSAGNNLSLGTGTKYSYSPDFGSNYPDIGRARTQTKWYDKYDDSENEETSINEVYERVDSVYECVKNINEFVKDVFEKQVVMSDVVEDLCVTAQSTNSQQSEINSRLIALEKRQKELHEDYTSIVSKLDSIYELIKSRKD